MYRAVTNGIQVTVEPFYLAEQSSPEESSYVWGYTVEIVNLGDVAVQLRRRHWLITDGNGQMQEVEGPGVVGEEPVIKPGEAFEYSSGCPLTTPSGIMEGAYLMELPDGRMINVSIPPFSLDTPNRRGFLN
jgi:ApaG protein